MRRGNDFWCFFQSFVSEFVLSGFAFTGMAVPEGVSDLNLNRIWTSLFLGGWGQNFVRGVVSGFSDSWPMRCGFKTIFWGGQIFESSR